MSVVAGSAVSTRIEDWEPPLPGPRGPLTDRLFAALAGVPGDVPGVPLGDVDPLSDDDFHLALYACYELHYRGFAGVDERWEWSPSLLAFRGQLEEAFESALRSRFGYDGPVEPAGTTSSLSRIAGQPGPPLSRYLRDRATQAEWSDYVVHRSAYQLKEADPHAWAVPRLEGRAKAALIEVVFDEYGCGRAERIHAALYRNSMEAIGLDGRYGAYLDRIPGMSLAPVNLMSMFGLHRRLRGALVGHLAIAEVTSSVANKRLADGLRRLGYGSDATHFFDEHVIADSIHDMISLHDLAGGLAEDQPHLVGDILFGATAWTGIDAMSGEFLLGAWTEGRPTLRPAEAAA